MATTTHILGYPRIGEKKRIKIRSGEILARRN